MSFFCFFARKQAFEADFGGKCAIFCDVGKNEVEKKQSRFLSNGESCWSAWASFLKNLQGCSLPCFAASFDFAVPSILYGKIWGQREKNRHKSDKKFWCVLETAFSTLQNPGAIFQFTFVLSVNPPDYVRGCFFLNFPSVSFFKAADPLCRLSSLVNVYTSVPRYPPFTPIGH